MQFFKQDNKKKSPYEEPSQNNLQSYYKFDDKIGKLTKGNTRFGRSWPQTKTRTLEHEGHIIKNRVINALNDYNKGSIGFTFTGSKEALESLKKEYGIKTPI